MPIRADRWQVDLCKALGLEAKKVRSIDVFARPGEALAINVSLAPDSDEVQAVIDAFEKAGAEIHLTQAGQKLAVIRTQGEKEAV